MAKWTEPPEHWAEPVEEGHDYEENCWCPSCGAIRGSQYSHRPGMSREIIDVTTLEDVTQAFQAFNGTFARIGASPDWGWDPQESEEPRREMIPTTAVLEIPTKEAERQQSLYAEIPDLTPREKNLMAIYDAVIAGEKVIRLNTVLNGAGAFAYEKFPKVALAPVTAERVTFRRFTRGNRVVPGKLNAYYQAGQWQYTLLKERGWDPVWNRVSHADGDAMTPLIPPPDRDKVQDGDLFLWEATWLNKRETVINYDPAVIRPLSNGLYKVVLAWDLTEAEAMILGGE